MSACVAPCVALWKCEKKNRENDKKLLFIYFGRSEIGLGGGVGCDGAINSNNNSLM